MMVGQQYSLTRRDDKRFTVSDRGSRHRRSHRVVRGSVLTILPCLQPLIRLHSWTIEAEWIASPADRLGKSIKEQRSIGVIRQDLIPDVQSGAW